jgi:hypothetical protein
MPTRPTAAGKKIHGSGKNPCTRQKRKGCGLRVDDRFEREASGKKSNTNKRREMKDGKGKSGLRTPQPTGNA